jgi:hypothetical protein
MHSEWGYYQLYYTAEGAANNREWAIKRLLAEYEAWTMSNATDPLPRAKWLNRVVIQ